MGATTLYHPISLHVIRGAAEYCGWKFSTIKQIAANPELFSALYEVSIEDIPAKLDTYGPEIMIRQLQHCFMDDIEVLKIWFTRSERWKAEIHCQLENKTGLIGSGGDLGALPGDQQ